MGETVQPATAMKTQLEAIGQTLERIAEQLTQQEAWGDQVEAYTKLVTEACQVLHEQNRAIHQGVETMLQRGDLPRLTPGHPGWAHWRAVLGGGIMGAVLASAMWLWWPTPPMQRLATSLDSVLVQQYGQLPKTAQEGIAEAYKRAGFQSPATRHKGNK